MEEGSSQNSEREYVTGLSFIMEIIVILCKIFRFAESGPKKNLKKNQKTLWDRAEDYFPSSSSSKYFLQLKSKPIIYHTKCLYNKYLLLCIKKTLVPSPHPTSAQSLSNSGFFFTKELWARWMGNAEEHFVLRSKAE